MPNSPFVPVPVVKQIPSAASGKVNVPFPPRQPKK